MEIWDLYDNQTLALTGETMRRGDPIPKGRCHLVVEAAVFSSDGRVLIQQRQPFKKPWPGYWEFSGGGSALAGENSQEAMHRELFEEIGLDVDFTGMRPVLRRPGEQSFQDWYAVTRDVPLDSLTLQESEARDAAWVTENEILRMIEEGTFIPYHPSFVSLLFHLHHHDNLKTHEE